MSWNYLRLQRRGMNFESWVCVKESPTASGESLRLFLGFSEESLESMCDPCLDALSFSFSSEHNVGKQLMRNHLISVRVVIRASWVILIFCEECIDMHINISYLI